MEGDHHSKAHKPLVERRRRERINRSLDELKTLVLHSLNRDERDYSRMEKADILEMAVRFLRGVHQTDQSVISQQAAPKYMAGFNQCAANVMWYVNRCPDIAPEIRLQLLQRLAIGLQRVHSNTHFNGAPEVDVLPPETGGFSRNQQPLHVPHDVTHRSHDVHDVRGYDYSCHDVRGAEVGVQDEVCDLSVKRSSGGESGGNQTSIGRWERLDEGSRITERERCDRYKALCEMKDPRDMGRANSLSQGVQGQSFLSDGVWRPF